MKNTIMPTRRSMMKSGLAVLGSGAAISAASHCAWAQEKIEQTLVQYQNEPKDGAECDKCVNWVAPNACKIVNGTINPKGWCVAFAPQGG